MDGMSKAYPDLPGSPPMAGEAPPPYSTMPNAPGDVGATAWGSPGSTGMPGYNPRGYKLGYMDFVPRVVRKKTFGPNVYEDHSTLVQRANNWLEEHDGLQVISCESVTWCCAKDFKNMYADNCYNIGNHPGRIRGFRIWYLTVLVPNAQQQRTVQVLQCRTFVPGTDERFNQLLHRVNESLSKQTLGGRIMSVEMVPVYANTDYRPGTLSANKSTFVLEGDHTKVLCMRVYALITGEDLLETIGYQDFVPEYTQRHKDNKGYEVFSEVADRACRWVAKQSGVRFTNLQSVNVKIKKKVAFEERCAFRDHSEAKFLSIVRAFFVIPQAGPGGAARPEFQPCRLTYRTFVPSQMSLSTVSIAVQYEDTRTLCDRLNQWLQITGAQVFSVETVPITLMSGFLGPEATYSKHMPQERILLHIRLYLNGDYMEPPGAVSLVVPSSVVRIAQSEPNLSYGS